MKTVLAVTAMTLAFAVSSLTACTDDPAQSSGSAGNEGMKPGVGIVQQSQGDEYWQTGRYRSALEVLRDR